MQDEERAFDPYACAFAALPVAACVFERATDAGSGSTDWRYVANNPAMQRLFRVGDLTGQTLRERFPDHADAWHCDLERVLERGETETLVRDQGPHAEIYEVTLSPLPASPQGAVLAVIRDITEERQTRQSLADSDIRYRTLFNAIDEGFCIIEVLFDEQGRAIDYRFLEANRSFASHTGFGDPVGKSMREVEPDLEERWFEIYGAIARTGEPQRFELESRALGRWFDVFAFPVGEPGSNRVGILFEDIAERKRMELALRESESRLSSLIDASSYVIFQLSPDWTEMRRLQGKGFVLQQGDLVNWIDDYVLPEDLVGMRAAIREAVDQRTLFEYEHRARKADGSIGWFLSRAVPMTDEEGRITEWFGMAAEITERKKVEEELAHGAEMLRVACEIGRVGVWDWNIRTNELVWSDEHYRMEGFAVGEITPSYEVWAERVHPDDRQRTEDAIQKARESGDEYVNEYRVVHPDGKVRWLSARGQFLYDADGQPVRMLGAMVDTTERRRQVEWQKLLVAELQHRVRNLISMVRSVARQSAGSHRDVEDYVDHLIGRLQAMGRTQSTLTRSPGANVDLAGLVREELLVHAAGDDKCHVEGPDVGLSPQAAEIVTLAMHELATNSIKYGALGGKGHIRIGWRLSDREGTRWLHLRWQETVAGRIEGPSRTGFGRQLIEGRVPYELHGEGRLQVHDTGVLAEMAFPLGDGASVFETASGEASGL